MGYQIGWDEGITLREKGVCSELDSQSFNEGLIKLGCTKIIVAGEAKYGYKAYEYGSRIYFVTNNGNFELDQDLNVVSTKKYHRMPEIEIKQDVSGESDG